MNNLTCVTLLSALLMEKSIPGGVTLTISLYHPLHIPRFQPIRPENDPAGRRTTGSNLLLDGFE
jgi:hypothetical protein